MHAYIGWLHSTFGARISQFPISGLCVCVCVNVCACVSVCGRVCGGGRACVCSYFFLFVITRCLGFPSSTGSIQLKFTTVLPLSG